MVDRLFQIVYLLMERPQITAKELAQRFEVSERTIYRDIDKLTLAGVPIYANQGKGGGISILPNYILDKAVLTAKEKEKIIESLQALNEVTYTEEKEDLSKLHSFLGEAYRDWIEIDFSSWGNSNQDAFLFAEIKRAIWECVYLTIMYAGNQGNLLERKIKPLKLCFKNQAWYLYAYCCMRKDYRFFKLRRISQITVLEEHFEPEDAGKVLGEGSLQYTEKEVRTPVTLEIDKEMAFRAYEELETVTEKENGKLHCTIEVTDMNWFISYILSYGSYIRILQPPAIKEKVIQEIKKMQEKYRDEGIKEN